MVYRLIVIFIINLILKAIESFIVQIFFEKAVKMYVLKDINTS